MDLAGVMGGQTPEPVVKDEVVKEGRGQGHSWGGHVCDRMAFIGMALRRGQRP